MIIFALDGNRSAWSSIATKSEDKACNSKQLEASVEQNVCAVSVGGYKSRLYTLVYKRNALAMFYIQCNNKLKRLHGLCG